MAFESQGRQLTPDGLPGDAIGDRGVYEWADGQLRFVSKLPSDQPVAGFVGAANETGQFYPGDHPVSDDGQRIFFTATDVGRGLYVREAGAVTRLVSASERAGDDPEAPTRRTSRPPTLRTDRWRCSRAARS